MASPFNRPNQGPFQGQPPPSFKTNVNRNKTKKWVEARGYTYDGDDWGEYDETDEYGVEDGQPNSGPQVPQQQQRVTGLRHAGQSAGGPQNGGRNFTDPRAAPSQQIQRQQSFDVGDERRAFSAGYGPPHQDQPYANPQGTPLHVETDVPSTMMQRTDTSSSRYPSAGGLASSSDNTPYSANPASRRDFSPSAMPNPLQSAAGPNGPQHSVDASSSTPARPPRKSSLSQQASPVAAETQAPVEHETPRQRAPSNPTKALPFIRPAEIYKRMEEERARERASQDSSRPSLDSLLRPNEELRGSPSKKSSSDSLPSVHEERTGTPASQRRPQLPTVAEGQPAAAPEPQEVHSSARQDFLPPSETSPSFSDEFQHFTSPREAQSQPGPEIGLGHQPSTGFRSVVEQAFDRPSVESPVPDTPKSTQDSLGLADQSDVSRSNTDSTAGISPIMSRVPSVGLAAAARANTSQRDSFDHNATPTIAEEPAGSSRPTSLQGPLAAPVPRTTPPGHSREPSAESAFIPGYRRQDTPPSRGSPARTAALEQGRRTPDPQVAHLASLAPAADASFREADLADAVNARPITAEERQVGDLSFTTDRLVLSHQEATPIELQESRRPESPAKSRSQSPSKTRVQQLAGKFDDISEANSRRNSSHSIASRQSWEVDSRKSWAEGSEQLHVEKRSDAPFEPALRPKLPGQWESFATNAPESDTPGSQNLQGTTADVAPEPHRLSESLPTGRATEIEPVSTNFKRASSSSEEQEQAPSITKNPLAALTAAGAAIGESLRSTVGIGNEAPKEAEGDKFEQVEDVRGDPGRLAVGDVVSRPGAIRTHSGLSSASTVPPTPPPKDSNPYASENDAHGPEYDDIKPPAPLKSREATPAPETGLHDQPYSDQNRPPLVSQLSANTAFDDDENERLRKDIVRTLSPDKTREDSSAALTDEPVNRESTILPAEYGDYWRGSTPEGARYSRMPEETSVGPRGVELATPDNYSGNPAAAPSAEPTRPTFLDNRFSWEKNRESIGFSQFMRGSTVPRAAVERDSQQTHSDGSDAPEVVEPPREPVAEPSSTVDDLPRQSLERSTSPPPTGLHIVNVRGAEEAVDLPPRLKTPEPPNDSRTSHEDASSGLELGSPRHSAVTDQQPQSVDERDFAAPSLPTADTVPASSLAPAAEITSPDSEPSRSRIAPFRELAAIPSPKDRIKAYNSTREQFATTDTGLQGWLAQTLAAYPEHSHLVSGGQPFPINTRTPTAGGRPGHRASPSMSKFTNVLSPSSPQQSQGTDAPSPLPGSSPNANQPSGSGGIGAQKGKELLQNAGALGGKVGQGAKGLFAKGRSKFRGASGSDKVSTPLATTVSSSPASSQTLSRAATQPIEQTQPIAQPTPTRRRSSPFQRFSSRPSSMAISEADTIPEVPNEPLPPMSRHSTPDNRSTASGVSISKRRMSPFRRRSRPSSAATMDSMAAVPEIPKEPLPTHQRSATFGGVLVNSKSGNDEDRGKLKGLRRLSAFRRSSRPSSIAVQDTDDAEAHFPGGFPKSLTYTGERRRSYAFGSSVAMPPPTAEEQRRASVAVAAARASLPAGPDIFGGPEQLQDLKDERPLSKLGILPTPTKESFGFLPSGPSSPKADDDSTPRATQFDPNQTQLEDHLRQFVPDSPESDWDRGSTPWGGFANNTVGGDVARQSRILESIVRHASPPLKEIESRRQSRVGIEPETAHMPLPNMGSVSGAPTPGAEGSETLPNSTPSMSAQKSPADLPRVEIPKSYSVKEGKMRAREEMVPSPEPPLPPAGAGVIPTSPVDDVAESKTFQSLDRNLSVVSKSSRAVSALEPSPERNSEIEGGAQGLLVGGHVENVRLAPTEDLQRDATVSRMVSDVSKTSRPDVSPISDESHDTAANLGLVQTVKYGERKADWLDDSDEDEMKTPMALRQPRVQSTVPIPYGQMDKEITIEPISRASTDDEGDRIDRENSMRADGAETREGFYTPTEELENDDEENVEINEAGTASSGHIRQISDIAKLNRESLGLRTEAAAARASVPQEPLPNQFALSQHLADQMSERPTPVDLQQGHRLNHEPDIVDLRTAAADNPEQEDLPPPVPPKSPGPAVPARQSPFNERESPVVQQPEPQQQGRLQRPSFGDERPLSFQMLPRPSSGTVPQEQIHISKPAARAARQPSPLASPPRIRPPIPQQRDYSQDADASDYQIGQDGDSPKGTGLRRTSNPVQPQPPSHHVRQQSTDRLSQPVQSASTNPQNNPTVSRSVDPRMFQGQTLGRPAIDPRQYTGTEFHLPGVGPPPPQIREPRGALPAGFVKGMSKQPSPGTLEQQQQPMRINPQAVAPFNQRMPSYTSNGSEVESPEEKKAKKSSFFAGLRPPSSGADTALAANGSKTRPATSSTKIHYLSDIERQKDQAVATGKLSKTDKRIERAQSSGEPSGGKKKRFSAFSGLFGRSGTTGHTPPSRASGSGKKLQRITEQKTPSPAQEQALPPPQVPYPYPQEQGQPRQPEARRGSLRQWNGPDSATATATAYQDGPGDPSEQVRIPPGGFYAPENNAFVPSQDSRDYTSVSQQADGSYSYGQGQPTLPQTEDARAITLINGGQYSPPPHRWRHPESSPPESGAMVSTGPTRHMSTGSYSQNPPQLGSHAAASSEYGASPWPARHASAPSHSQVYGHLRPQHAPRMPSIGEDGRHQERPWAIQLPQGPPDPQNDAHRRDSIQYAMMIRQQMAQQQSALEQQSPQAAYQAQNMQYAPPPVSQSFASHAQPPYDLPTYPTPSGHHPQGRYSEIRGSQGPVLTLDPAAIARVKLEAQERARQQQMEAQRQEQQRLQQQHEEAVAAAAEQEAQRRTYSPPDDENSLYAPPTRPQTAHSPPPPLPTQYAQSPPQLPPLQTSLQHPPRSTLPQRTQGYEPGSFQQPTGQTAPVHGAEPQHYPLPTSPTSTIASPINVMAGRLPPPPFPPVPQQPHQSQQPQLQQYYPPPQQSQNEDADSKAVGFGAHRNYPSASSIAAPPPPYRRDRASVDERMDVPSETLMRTERRTEELRSHIEERRRQNAQNAQRARQDEDEPVVMHAASYPGMEWEPRWEE